MCLWLPMETSVLRMMLLEYMNLLGWTVSTQTLQSAKQSRCRPVVTISAPVFPRCDGSSWYSGQPCHVCWVHCHPAAVCAGLGGYCHGNRGHVHAVPPPPHSHVGQDHRQDSEAGVQHPHQHPSRAGIPLRTLQHHLTSGQSS